MSDEKSPKGERPAQGMGDAQATQELAGWEKPTRDEAPEDERPTVDMSDEEEGGGGLSPAQRRAFGEVLRGMARLAKLLSERGEFSAGPVFFKFVRPLEERKNGMQVLLFERHLRHGLAGHVVVKRLQNPMAYARRLRMKEEVHLAFRLHHPAIAQVHHFTVIERRPHIVMEYVDGPLFDTLLTTAALRGVPLSASFALYVLSEVADALHYAHTLTEDEEGGRPLGIIHRDVSPRNIRVSRRSGAVKLTDFGAAYSQRVGREETAGRLVKGDVQYASPEYLHRLPMDPRSDIFSLGLVLLEALTGGHPFNLEDLPGAAPEPVDVVADEAPSVALARTMALVDRYTPEDVERVAALLPEGLKAIVRRALKRRPAERYATAAEMLRDMRAQLSVLAPGYGRKEAAEEVELLISQASALCDLAEPVEAGLYPEDPEEHELTTG